MIQRLRCPICQQSTQTIFSRPFHLPQLQRMIARSGLADLLVERSYDVRACRACDSYFQSWVMEENELANWYSPPADDSVFLQAIAKQKLHWFAHMIEEILVFRQLCPERAPAVLDFGCNWGKWASAALALGCNVYGVDVNRAAAGFCAQRGIKMIGFDQLGRSQFDFINVDQVLEHLSDPRSVTRQLAACLKPGAFIKMSTPGNARLPKTLEAAQHSGNDAVLNERTIDSLFPLEHVNLFSRRGLLNLGEKVGLQPFRLPLIKWLGAGQLWNIPRQFNRNLVVPFKRWLGRGTYLWLQKPPA